MGSSGVTRGCWFPHPSLGFPSSALLPILISPFHPCLLSPGSPSWALCSSQTPRGAARLIPGDFTASFPADRPPWHFLTSLTLLAVLRTELPLHPRHTDTLPTAGQTARSPPGEPPSPGLPPGAQSSPWQEGWTPCPVPRAHPGLGRGREGPRPPSTPREVTWLRIFVPVLQLEKLKPRGAGSQPHPCCSRASIRAPTGMESVQFGVVTRGKSSSSLSHPWPGLALPAWPLAGGEAEPSLEKCHRRPKGQVLFRKLWENMFMPRIRAAPLAAAAAG